ncbi:MAG: hypothetical protein EXS27_01005 [Pedosphaera sp.]|nr:hypothetical protein [Pedosphaera sp.]
MVVALQMAGAGCRRKANTAPLPSAASESLPDRLPNAPNDSSLHLPIHPELTGAVHLYRTDHGKLPPDFETLVKERYLKALPAPPPGKRFAVDRNRLQVVITD